MFEIKDHRSTLSAFRFTIRAMSMAILLLLATACRQDMHDQPRYEPLERSTFFNDGRSARPFVEGTVARGQLKTDEHFYTGKVSGELVNALPFPATKEVLDRGHERYNIYCSPCHDRVGNGQGMIVQRGFRQPPSLHIDRLRQAPLGHFFDVMTNGFGTMYSYADRIAPRDRWAIVAYIRALQMSQNAALDDVPVEERSKLLERGK
jgi:mono/diheme cytochrome c family protein